MVFKKILVALDYSSLSQTVFDRAVELTVANHASLRLFHCMTADVVATPPPFTGELGISAHLMNQAYQSQLISLEQQTQQVQAWLERYCDEARRQGVEAEMEHRIDDPSHGICQEAQRWGADLIVLGRRGHGGLTEILLGSVSNYVLHHAACAVLVIQGQQQEQNAVSSSDQAVQTVGG